VLNITIEWCQQQANMYFIMLTYSIEPELLKRVEVNAERVCLDSGPELWVVQ